MVSKSDKKSSEKTSKSKAAPHTDEEPKVKAGTTKKASAKKSDAEEVAKTEKTVKPRAKSTKKPVPVAADTVTEVPFNEPANAATNEENVEAKTAPVIGGAAEEAKMTKAAEKKEDHSMVEVTSPKKVVKMIKGYGKHDLERFRQIILDKRNEIIEQLQNLREQMMDPTTGQYVNENSPYSLHMAEQGTDAMEREKIFLWAQRENKFLGYLDEALNRIESGTYGICIECIDEPQYLCPTCPLISKERLAAVPHSQLCLPVKQKQEKR